jgi:hypothetical protein
VTLQIDPSLWADAQDAYDASQDLTHYIDMPKPVRDALDALGELLAVREGYSD